jgi:hypothetical protein
LVVIKMRACFGFEIKPIQIMVLAGFGGAVLAN